MAKMQGKRNQQLTHNIQMMTAGKRTNEAWINIVTRSGAATGSGITDGKKESKSAWVRKIAKKVPIFDIQKEKEVFMEVKRSFMDVSTLTYNAQPRPDQKK